MIILLNRAYFDHCLDFDSKNYPRKWTGFSGLCFRISFIPSLMIAWKFESRYGRIVISCVRGRLLWLTSVFLPSYLLVLLTLLSRLLFVYRALELSLAFSLRYYAGLLTEF